MAHKVAVGQRAAVRSAAVAAAICAALASPADARALTETDKDAICRVVYAEAGAEPLAGRVAVAAVILTRMGADKSAVEVVSAPSQFEPVTRAGGDYRRLPLRADQAVECRTILDLASAGLINDPTGKATHFQNPAIVAERARKGSVRQSLVDFGGLPVTADIGRHRFYRGTVPSAARAPKKAPSLVSRPRGGSMTLEVRGLHEGRETVLLTAPE